MERGTVLTEVAAAILSGVDLLVTFVRERSLSPWSSLRFFLCSCVRCRMRLTRRMQQRNVYLRQRVEGEKLSDRLPFTFFPFSELIALPLDACPSNCHQNGSCTKNDEGEWHCACLPGFRGDSCNIGHSILYTHCNMQYNERACIQGLKAFATTDWTTMPV